METRRTRTATGGSEVVAPLHLAEVLLQVALGVLVVLWTQEAIVAVEALVPVVVVVVLALRPMALGTWK